MSQIEHCVTVGGPSAGTDRYLLRSLRAMIGVLYFLSFILLGSGISLLPLLIFKSTRELWPYLALVGILAMAGVLSMLARGLRSFRPWARIATLVISSIGVFVFPLGTLLFSPFFYVLIKAKHLFAQPPQPDTISAPAPTPDIDRFAA